MGRMFRAFGVTGYVMVHHMDDATSTTLVDSVGSYNGTKRSATQPTEIAGPVGGAQDFNGDSYVDIPMTWGGGPVTFEFWNYVAAVETQNSNVFSFNVDRMDSHAPWGDDNIYWDYGPACCSDDRLSTDYTPYYDSWTHVVLSSEGNEGSSEMQIFFNGRQAVNNFAGGEVSGGSLFRLGIKSSYHPGMVDEFRMSRVVRSDDWVNQTYQMMSNPGGVVIFGSGEKYEKGLISTVTGDLPFYTNESNPRTVNLNASQSELVTFWVNASAISGMYEFFAFGNVTRNMSITNVTDSWNVTIVVLDNTPPVVSLLYPLGENYSSSYVPEFNFSVSEESIDTCELWGNWSGGWHLNQTIVNASIDVAVNFTGISVSSEGYYVWNVRCNDTRNNVGWAGSNGTFAMFFFPYKPLLLNASQAGNDGTGNVTLYWNASTNALAYRIYYNSTMSGDFGYLGETSGLNFTDSTFNGSVRRFYRIDAWNPVGQNASLQYFGAHVYTLRHNGNTRNWIGFPTNASYLVTANDSLYEMTNVTTVTTWNATRQNRVTCNEFTCPEFPACTNTTCNFDLMAGIGYEVNVNGTTSASAFNWSLVGIVYDPVSVQLIKNDTNFGKNWISLYANTTLGNARSILENVTNSDATANWNSVSQSSEGLIPSPFPFGPSYIGTNFNLTLEKGYEVSVNETTDWLQP
ncbi:MAG: LamG-like jellyroll fold domain-containing protein [archaeon]